MDVILLFSKTIVDSERKSAILAGTCVKRLLEADNLARGLSLWDKKSFSTWLNCESSKSKLLQSSTRPDRSDLQVHGKTASLAGHFSLAEVVAANNTY